MAFDRAKRDVRLRRVGFKNNDKTFLLLWQKLVDRVQARLPEGGRILMDGCLCLCLCLWLVDGLRRLERDGERVGVRT
jgi:hypothetical protein